MVGETKRRAGIAFVALSDRYNRVWVERIWEEHRLTTQKGVRMQIRQIGDIIGASYFLILIW